ncbi:hypothetical protein SAMN02745146_0871 [Hymenobacter daecheongensis DSM 21074]|uniref:Toprim-like n=1 Tax=Hymenobacter daecheongensis DSM 21074 TaxID=1121955 RepID=A0A1M6B4F5_9BACT|nr:DUF6371 domain-containing protein [Hymenobacter daecheongensis]SHI43611.1 hypothetical protein SAMN02745146_0871 [Hymenobacter daecheongensis DSM 21074]
MSLTTLRYRLEPYSGSKSRFTCPSCGRPREFSRWVDTQTGNYLPDSYGICNRADSCGYSLSPYQKGERGARGDILEHHHIQAQAIRNCPKMPLSYPTKTICSIPVEVMEQTLGQYDKNNFALLLQRHFGCGEADSLLQRFEIGTSRHWPGATIFWQRDVEGLVRGGQVVLFDEKGHTAKAVCADGSLRRCTTWVHAAYAKACRKHGKLYPSWLVDYLDPANEVKKSPSLYGLPQVLGDSPGRAVAIVEAPKTAILCTAYMPSLSWVAVGSLTYLNAERLRPLKSRRIVLYPDASSNGTAYSKWLRQAELLRYSGFQIEVSSLLERRATAEQKAAGIDLADVLLSRWPGYPPSWDC